jgi:hypothetical protein
MQISSQYKKFAAETIVQRRSESTADSGHGIKTEELFGVAPSTHDVWQAPMRASAMSARGNGHGCQGASFIGLRVIFER